MTSRDHWPLHARQWAQIGPPLRPAPEDIAICERAAVAWAARTGRAPRVLLLGVTPEIATMQWPAGTRLVAVDRSQAMIDAVFPSHAGEAVVGDWRALPSPANTFDWIVGDGCASVLAFPAGYHELAAELHRVLASDGELVLRLFAAPIEQDTEAAIVEDVRHGRIASFHALKWRIAMAIQTSCNVRVADILRAFDAMFDRRELARWSAETIATIDVYRDSELTYSFPTVDEARAALRGFVETACHVPAYELGDRCPTLVLRRG